MAGRYRLGAAVFPQAADGRCPMRRATTRPMLALVPRRRHAMTETTAGRVRAPRAPAPTAVPGATWYGAMVALWSIFFTLLVISPGTLDDVYDWLTGLALVWEVLMWIVLLPWALAYLALESSWANWLQILVVVLIVVVHLSISTPKQTR
jgi:hypothetical protein